MNLGSKVILKALSSTLSYYFDNFDKDAFNLGFGKEQTVHMENLVLNNAFIKETIVLPNMRIVKAATNCVDVTIPWTSINSQPIVIEMDQVHLELEEYPPDFDKEEEERKMLEKRKKKKPKESSYGFVQKCVDGVKMYLKDMHLSLRINGYRNNPSRLRAHFHGMHVFSADKSWNPIDLKSSFKRDPKDKMVEFFKVLTTRRIDVSIIEEGEEAMVTKEAFIMRECPVECRARIKKDMTNGRVLCGTFDMLVRDVEVVFSDKTWKGFMEMIKGLLSAMTRTDLDYGIGKMLEEGEKSDKDIEKERKAAEALAKRIGSSATNLKDSANNDEEKVEGKKDENLEGYVPRPASSDDRQPDIDWAVQDLDNMDEALYQTSFNMYISDAMMYCLDEKDTDSEDPAEDALLKGYLHDMRCHLVLPPVGIDWGTPEQSKKLVFMGTTVRSCVLTGVERIQTKDKIKKRQLVLATDVDNEALRRRADLRKKKKAMRKEQKKSEKEAAERAKDQEGRKLTKDEKKERRRMLNQKDPFFTADYVHEIKQREMRAAGKSLADEPVFMKGDWVIISSAAEDQNMEKWLRSLFSRIKMWCWSPQLLFASAWWARIMRFFEISSLSTTSVDAEMLIRLCASGSTYDAMCTFPLQSFADKFGYRPIEPIAQASRGLYKMYSPKIDIGRMILGDEVTALFRSARPPLPRVEAPPMNLGKKSEQQEQATPDGCAPYESITENRSAYELERMVHIRKPIRYQMKIHKAQFEIDNETVFKNSDLCGEIVLHRLYETDQLMMEIFSFIHKIDITLKYRQYFLFHHFTDYVVDNTFIALESVLLRKFGPARIQTALLTKIAEEVAVDEGRQPVVLSSKYWVDKMNVKVLGSKGNDAMNVCLHGVEGNSNNSRWLEKGAWEKVVNITLLEMHDGAQLPTDDLTEKLPDSHLKLLKAKLKAARKRGEALAVKGELKDWEKRDCGITFEHVRGNLKSLDPLEEFSMANEFEVLKELDEKIVAEIKSDMEGQSYGNASAVEGGNRKKGVAEVVADDVKFDLAGDSNTKIPPRIVRLLDEFLLIETNE